MEEIGNDAIQTKLKDLSRRKAIVFQSFRLKSVQAIAYKLSKKLKRKYTVKHIVNCKHLIVVNREK